MWLKKSEKMSLKQLRNTFYLTDLLNSALFEREMLINICFKSSLILSFLHLSEAFFYEQTCSIRSDYTGSPTFSIDS